MFTAFLTKGAKRLPPLRSVDTSHDTAPCGHVPLCSGHPGPMA